MSWTKYLNPFNDLNNGEVSNTDPNDPNNPNYMGTGMTQAAYYAALAAGGQNASAAGAAAGNVAATNSQNDPNNTTANPIPAGMTQAQYDAALAAGGQNATAAAGAAGDVAANTAYTTDPNDSSNPNSIAGGGGGNPGNAGLLSGPGPGEQGISQIIGAGAYADPTSAENLYSQAEAGGQNQFYDNAQKTAAQAINDAAAARGNWNSSATLYNLGSSANNIRGQQAKDMSDEAAASDAGYNSRITGLENLYTTWQGEEEKRLGDAGASTASLAAPQAADVMQAFQKAGDLSNADNMQAFNAQLQKLGIDPTSQAVQDLIKALGAGAAVAAA